MNYLLVTKGHKVQRIWKKKLFWLDCHHCNSNLCFYDFTMRGGCNNHWKKRNFTWNHNLNNIYRRSSKNKKNLCYLKGIRALHCVKAYYWRKKSKVCAVLTWPWLLNCFMFRLIDFLCYGFVCLSLRTCIRCTIIIIIWIGTPLLIMKKSYCLTSYHGEKKGSKLKKVRLVFHFLGE